MQADGTEYAVDWYFVPSGTPPLNRPNGGSNNWLKPDHATGPIREVVDVPRPWRDGSIPAYVGFDARPGGSHPIAGLTSWWKDGAPGPGSGGLRWDGSRGFTNVDGPGIFPPAPTGPFPTCTSATRGVLTPGGGPPGYPYWWTYKATLPTISVGFYPLDKLAEVCRPGLKALHVNVGGWPAGATNPLRCTSYNATTGISIWRDAGGFGLDSGDTITLSP